MLFEVKNLKKRYGPHLPFVINDVSFTIDRGQTIGIFGGSGNGKSTIGQVVAGIYPKTSGEIYLDGEYISGKYRGDVRRKIQILFQHPETSFNPRMKMIDSLKEPYKFYKLPYSESAFFDYLYQFGIYPEHMDRYPAELSGGELQRVAIARTMLVEPELLVLDEPTSMLDVVSQAQVIILLNKIQEKRNTGYLFISHDFELCKKFCDKIFYLENGYLAEK